VIRPMSNTAKDVRVLVCGGRDYSDYTQFAICLTAIHQSRGIKEVIHGGARGADTLAGNWASARGIPTLVYHADWEKYGRRAGPLRNEQMLKEGKPDLVVAFPGGRGTAHMVRISTEAGVPVFKAPGA
jgi:predicted Rossmann-fold nucleotide-binding protein